MTDIPPPDDRWRRPDGTGDATIEATGKLSEALEWVERARGRLFDFHQMLGRADFLMEDAAELLRSAGHDEQARLVEEEIVGRNVLEGRWTYQIVEEFEDAFWEPVRAAERRVRDELVAGKRHVYEAEMKEQRRSRGRPGHEARPPGGGPL